MTDPTPSVLANAAATLTNGNPVSSITAQKFFKDFVLDFLMTVPLSVGAVSLLDLQNKAALVTAFLGIGNALIGAGYRAALRWAQSPSS